MNQPSNQFREILEEMAQELSGQEVDKSQMLAARSFTPAKKAPAVATIQQADRIAASTGRPFGEGGAYSSDAYTPNAWRECCRMLARRGFSGKQIEWIMRSKFTRWASDGRKAKAWGRATSKDLARFLDDSRPPITPVNLDENS